MSNYTGFDPSVVSSSIGSVITAYNSLVQALGHDMQTRFVGGMSDKWACNEAITFFRDLVKPAVDQLLSSSDQVFNSVVASMNDAASNWAERTDSDFSPIPFSTQNVRLDVSPIVENIGGVRGIDYENANSVISQLSVIAQSADSALSSAKSAVDNCGFVGNNQAESLQASLGIIQSKISAAANEISTATTSALNATVASYGDLAGKVAEAFTVNE